MASPSCSSSSSSLAQHRQAITPLCTPAHLLAHFTSPLPSRLYSRQYAALYDFRLRKLRRGRLLAKAKARWQDTHQDTGGEGKPTYTDKILEVKRGKVTYITGIVYTEMRLKPDVLQDLTREQYLPPLPPVASYTDPTTDHVYLEDESGRLQLVGSILSDEAHRGSWITGTVGAFLGTEMENGEFHVQDVCWPGLPEMSSGTTGLGPVLSKNKKVKLEFDEGREQDDSQTRAETAADREGDDFLVLLSGLDLGSDSSSDESSSSQGHLSFASSEFKLAMLTEWIGGELDDKGSATKASRIAGMVVAGNLMAVQNADGSLFYTPDGTNGTTSTSGDSRASSSSSSFTSKSNKPTAASKASAALNPSPPSVLLSHLLPLSASLPIVLMPGATDPASAALPQQGIHRAVLPGTGRWSGSGVKGDEEGSSAPAKKMETRGGIELYNNPTWIQFGQKKILATSGQNLDDMMKYVPLRSKPGKVNGTSLEANSGEEEKMEMDSGETIDGKPDSKDSAVQQEPEGDEEREEEEEKGAEDERLTAAGRLLDFGHVAPTAPDTLWCFPFTDRDPFILDTTPDFLVIGNQPNFATKVVYHHNDDSTTKKEETLGSGGGSSGSSNSSGSTRVILLPRFSKTGEVAMLNLRSGVVRKVKIGCAP